MTNFEINPPDEPCPDCGSTKHKACKADKRKDLQENLHEIFTKPTIERALGRPKKTIDRSKLCTCLNYQGDHEEDCYWGGADFDA